LFLVKVEEVEEVEKVEATASDFDKAIV